MSEPTQIDICICTFRRPQVTFTLRSLAEMEIPEGYAIRVVVADNDSTPSAQTTIAQAAETYGLTITYVHAPEANISVARNACLDAATADYVAFIDDDQIVSPEWLTRIVRRMEETRADVILGPVQALYPDDCARWLVTGNFHSNTPTWVRGKIITGYTCNVLMHRTAPAIAPLRFDLALGVSGGEDTDYFARASTAGARIDYAPDAVIFEGVPRDRANLRWLLKRRYRYGQTHAMVLRRKGWHIARGLLAGAKAAICLLPLPFTLTRPAAWRFWLLRGTLHLATARTLLGPQPVTDKSHVH